MGLGRLIGSSVVLGGSGADMVSRGMALYRVWCLSLNRTRVDWSILAVTLESTFLVDRMSRSPVSLYRNRQNSKLPTAAMPQDHEQKACSRYDMQGGRAQQ